MKVKVFSGDDELCFIPYSYPLKSEKLHIVNGRYVKCTENCKYCEGGSYPENYVIYCGFSIQDDEPILIPVKERRRFTDLLPQLEWYNIDDTDHYYHIIYRDCRFKVIVIPLKCRLENYEFPSIVMHENIDAELNAENICFECTLNF